MKKLLVVLCLVVMFGLVAYVPAGLAAEPEVRRPRRTPTPRPPSPPAPAHLTAPVLLTPANGSTVAGQLNFTWTAVPGAARYHIQAGSGTDFYGQYNILENWSLTQPSYSFYASSGFVFYFRRLYWRVQAIDANYNEGPWSEVWMMNLVAP